MIAETFLKLGIPNQIQTGVSCVKGRCPRSLDDRDINFCGSGWSRTTSVSYVTDLQSAAVNHLATLP